MPYISDIFATIVDTETGDFRFLPFPGSLMDQPYMTMNILKVIQETYRADRAEKMEKMKKMKPSGGGSNNRRRRK